MTNQQQLPPTIPAYTWSRPLGLGWNQPYTVRTASNIDDGPWHGMPLGGFGAGCIGRSSRGDFNLWHIDGGEHTFKSIPACQFSVFEEQAGVSQAYALCTQKPQDGSLQTWRWYPQRSLEQDTGVYHALYPRSWFVYENVFKSRLTCEQFSPVWADNYQETSYPVAVFVWTADNCTQQPLTISIMLTWENMVGWFQNAIANPQVRMRDDGSPEYEYQPQLENSVGNFNRLLSDDYCFGCLLERVDNGNSLHDGIGQWAIASINDPDLEISYHTRWNPIGTGEDISQFAVDGALPNHQDSTPANDNEQLAAAIAVRFTLQPGETRAIPFVLAWDFPITEFGKNVKYYRRYTDFFGRDGKNAWAIARTALQNYHNWQQQITSWQQPILDREDLPSVFKMALFNELYNLTNGGTLWSAASKRDPVGQFAVLECFDYRWYESLDVRLYGSFALLTLWSELEKSVIRAFARAIPHQDDTTRVIGYYYTMGAESPLAVRKVAGATPHDLGAPNEHPWEQTNYTSYQDCNLWKDLACDFVLQVYRDFKLTGATDVQLLSDCWAAIVQTLNYLKTFDVDDDGIPENSGAPDQTFDDWRLHGVSAYCGGLWLAALEAAITTGKTLLSYPADQPLNQNLTTIPPIQETIATYQSWLETAQIVYQDKLWNGQYYQLDSKSGSDVVMADQLCGQFYARLLQLPDIVPHERAAITLKTIYDACFVKFHNGLLGAANGVKSDGSPENPNATHPLEVWTGINFGLAAFLIQMDMKSEAFQLTEAVIHQIYDNGLQFRTPEAITANRTFRACHYLRPLAIWAIYSVLSS